MPLNPDILATDTPAIMQAYRWLDAATLPEDKPFLNVSQAAPALPPPEPLRQHMAELVLSDTSAHLYGPDLGHPPLRAALAANISAHYGGGVAPDQIAITAGCNQAYTAVIATLAQAGDEVIIPTPWYFNHQMWLTMNGIRPVPLPCGASLMPDPDEAAALITERTRAIVLVTPNNPTGQEYPADLIRAFHALAQRHGIALIVDETYRDFHAASGAPHDLFTDPDWAETFIHLYSFSKAYRLTGHRVGAIATSEARLVEVEKYLDSTTICAPQLGQRAALWGLENLGQWVAGERAEILDRRAAMTELFDALPGWHLRGCGAYFAFVDYPFDADGETVAKALLHQQSVLSLPGAMFAPKGDLGAARSLRLAFANIDRTQIGQLHDRFSALSLAP
ncbi:Aspartate aminotransferase [Candidatus Rhodobacter oscarellae]|uniref:aspartate transaminase n=2 Tax=Candidatus Rhodobacter oscarellae TaxID=1675527 RepID=A0A0J9GT68_9RHOB|nr:Aspartate aminotransferase [Candidatus Rhodobacter lobularis]